MAERVVVARAPDRRAAPARSRTRPGGRSTRIRQAVRRATLELLAEKGFTEIRLPAVARRAGVNKTTIYRWWSSPLDLVQEALEGFEALALPDIDTGSFEGDLQAFARARLRLIRDPTAAAIFRAVIAVGHADATLAQWVERFWKPREREWRSPIERAIERGELSPAARAVPLVELVAGPLLLTHLATRRPLSRRALAALVETVASGVEALHGRSAPRRR
jgi:AcrR family transcriptional regulator